MDKNLGYKFFAVIGLMVVAFTLFKTYQAVRLSSYGLSAEAVVTQVKAYTKKIKHFIK